MRIKLKTPSPHPSFFPEGNFTPNSSTYSPLPLSGIQEIQTRLTKPPEEKLVSVAWAFTQGSEGSVFTLFRRSEPPRRLLWSGNHDIETHYKLVFLISPLLFKQKSKDLWCYGWVTCLKIICLPCFAFRLIPSFLDTCSSLIKGNWQLFKYFSLLTWGILFGGYAQILLSTG